jgi:Zn-dependent metalloprotease
MAKLAGLKAKIDPHPKYKVPYRIYDMDWQPHRGTTTQIAEAALKKIAPAIHINPDLSQLKFDKVKESLLGRHVFYQQYHNGKPISGAWIKVDIDKDGNVFNITNDLVPLSKLPAAKSRTAGEQKPRLSKAEAKARIEREAEKRKATDWKILDTELVYYTHDEVPVLAWKLIVKMTLPKKGARQQRKEWKIYLNANTGTILDRVNLIKEIAAKGRVFDPNPVVVLNDTTLKDKSTIPDGAYSDVQLNGLTNATGFLDGAFVSTRRTKKRVKRTTLQFVFNRSDRPFKEVMVYFHIDRVQRYIQELGFNNVLNHAIEVNIDGQTDDNSHYSPSDKSLTFGTGGVDDAEDAEIILHEYGHAIQDDQVPGFGESHEAGSMGEGFGDYWAGSFFSEHKPERMRLTVGNWDAVAYSDDDPPCLRRLDSSKKYPKNMDGEVHDDGEIWSACLWQIRTLLGRKNADKLIIAHHFLISRKVRFADAANALIIADKQLNKGKNAAAIRGIFVKRGILSK